MHTEDERRAVQTALSDGSTFLLEISCQDPSGSSRRQLVPCQALNTLLPAIPSHVVDDFFSILAPLRAELQLPLYPYPAQYRYVHV